MNLYIWGWPSFLGGADTKVAHLIDLLHEDYDITVIPNDPNRLTEQFWVDYILKYGAHCCSVNSLPSKIDGISLSLCNPHLFKDGIIDKINERGTKLIWSTEMVWHHDGELEAIKNGKISKVLYVSEIQKSKLRYPNTVPSSMTGNYINPAYFPFKERDNVRFTIGRLSRHDGDKYPADFPVYYESLGIPNVKFRVMAWSNDLRIKYRWHVFDDRWDLLEANQETQLDFLQSLDLFIYPLGHRFTESWGRSTVEAMLTGAIPIVPSGHNFNNLIEHGVSGFILDDFQDVKSEAQRLYRDNEYRKRMSRQCANYAREKICDREHHLKIWKEALDV